MGIPDDDVDDETGKLLAVSRALAAQAEKIKQTCLPSSAGYDEAVAALRLERLKLALCQTQTSTDAIVLLHAALEVGDALRCQALTGTLRTENVALLATELINSLYSVITFHERRIGATTNELGLAPVAPVEMMRYRNATARGLSHGIV